MNANQITTGRGHWLAWFLASAMGYGVGGLLGLYFAYGIFHRDPIDTLVGLTLRTVMGATGGYLQWVVLRERVAETGRWALTGALGFAAAMGTLV